MSKENNEKRGVTRHYPKIRTPRKMGKLRKRFRCLGCGKILKQSISDKVDSRHEVKVYNCNGCGFQFVVSIYDIYPKLKEMEKT